MARADLTPFPDGVGYLEHAWAALSATQRRALLDHEAMNRARLDTWRVLLNRELVARTDAHAIPHRTQRGAALVRWALDTGRVQVK